MTQADVPAHNSAMLWSGRVITGLMALLFGFSAVMKLMGGKELEESMAHHGLPLELVVPLAILELTCLALYLFPRTAFLGAVLLTGYMGGAICTHWRVGDVFVAQIVFGVLVWLGIALRDPRIFALLPLRRSPG